MIGAILSRMNDPASDTSTGPTPVSASVSWGDSKQVLQVVMFTDIVGSVGLQQTVGTERYAALLQSHDALFMAALEHCGAGRIVKHTGDGFLALFDRASDAVRAALYFQSQLSAHEWPKKAVITVRVGIHSGELLMTAQTQSTPGIVGDTVNLAARVMGLAAGKQILVTRGVFDDARQFVRSVNHEDDAGQQSLRWEAHGSYLVKGMEHPVEVFEVGRSGTTAFACPQGNAQVTRSVSAEDEATLGWRPAVNLEIPRRNAWRLKSCIGEGGFGEVWLAENPHTRESRVFKFCFDALRLRSFKREIAIFRLIRERLGSREDIATLYEVQLEHAPFFLESEYCSGGTLKEWLLRKSATTPVPMETRLMLIAKVARALAAAHSVGIIHKDVKPSNIFVAENQNGSVQPRLADFGIGVLMGSAEMPALDFSFTANLTQTGEASRTGTRMYSAPEYMIGRPPSIQADVYSLGVLLYHVVLLDFERPLGVGWQREIKDQLLLKDIEQCVDVEPERRFSSALQLAEHLETLPERRAVWLAEQERARNELERQAELVRHRSRVRVAWLATTVSVCLLAAALTVAWTLMQSRRATLEHAAEIEAQKESAEDQLYTANMMAITEDLIQHRETTGRSLVEKHRPAAGGKDRRGWEWYFAKSLMSPPQIKAQVTRGPLHALALNQNQSEVAVAGDDGMISVWSTATVKKLREWKAGTTGVLDLSWNQIGELAAVQADGTLSVWQDGTGRLKKRWQAHTGKANVVSWCPVDTNVLASGGDDGAAKLWQSDGEPSLSTVRKGAVMALGWRETGDQMAVEWSSPPRVVVGHPAALRSARERVLKGPVSPLHWRPKESQIAIAMDGLPLRSWVPASDSDSDSFWLLSSRSPGTSSVAWDSKGDVVAVGGIDGKIMLIDGRRLQEARNPLLGHTGAVNGLGWVRDKRLISIGTDGTLRAWDALQTSNEVRVLKLPAEVLKSAWSPAADRLAVLVAGDEVQVWDAETWQMEWSGIMPPPTLCGETAFEASVAWSADGARLAAACSGRGVALWDAATHQRLMTWALPEVTQLAWLEGGRTLFARHGAAWDRLDDKEMRWSPRVTMTGKPFLVSLSDSLICEVTLSARTLHVRSVNTADEFHQNSEDVPGEITCTAISKDRRLLAVGTSEGVILWLDVTSQKWTRPIIRHAGPVRALDWSPDTTRLVSLGDDEQCRVFNTAQAAPTWLLLPKLTQNNQKPNDATWSADGRKIQITARGDSSVTIFDASTGWRIEHGEAAIKAPRDNWQAALHMLAEAPMPSAAWQSIEKALPNSEATPQRQLLQAACALGRRGPVCASTPWSGAIKEAVTKWRDLDLPPPLMAAQWSVLNRWSDVLRVCDAAIDARPGAHASNSWHHLMAAQALEKMERADEARRRWQAAWSALAAEAGASTTAIELKAATDGSIDLSGISRVPKSAGLTDGFGNNMGTVPDSLRTTDGRVFVCANILPLARLNFRFTSGGMLPRLTAPLALGPMKELSVLIASVRTDEDRPERHTCLGHIFLHHTDGTASCIPLIYGGNVWDWWVPDAVTTDLAPPDRVVWKGSNTYAAKKKNALALYQLDWTLPTGVVPVKTVSFTSMMGDAAPVIVGLSVKP